MKKSLLFIFFLSFLTSLQAQTQIGTNLIGENDTDLSGTSVAINNVGNFVVVGAPNAVIAINGGVSVKGGHVRTYAYNGTVWTAGQDFDAEEQGDNMGFAVAVNGEGSIIACAAPSGNPNGANSGYVHVYIAQGNNPIMPNNYIRLGSDLDGENAADRFGQSIAINEAGTRLIIGAPGGNYVKIYEKTNSDADWNQLGQTLTGDNNMDLFGTSVDINAAGDRIVIGDISNDNGGTDAGRVKVFELVNNAWVQLGTNIDGASGNRAGHSVSIDDVGNTIAVGFSGLSVAGVNDSGVVKVFELSANIWQQQGSNIVGRAFAKLGGSGNNQQEGALDLHAGGTRLVVGAKTYTDQNVTQKGYVAHYAFANGVWSQTGNEIIGSGSNDEFGTSVAINDSDGTIVIGGAPFADANGSDSGYSALYDFNMPLNIEENVISDGYLVYPNPSSDKVQIQGNNIKQITLIDIQGKTILSSKEKSINVSGFKSGVYFLKIENHQHKMFYQRLVKK